MESAAASVDQEERDEERDEQEKEDLSEDENGDEPVRWNPKNPWQWGVTREAQIREMLQLLASEGFLVGDDVQDTMRDVSAVLQEAINRPSWWRCLEMGSSSFWTCVFAMVRKYITHTEWCVRGHIESDVDSARERWTIDYLHDLLKNQKSSGFSDHSAGNHYQTTAATKPGGGFSREVTRDADKRRRLDVRPLGKPRQRRRKMQALQVLFLEAGLEAIPPQIMRLEKPSKFMYSGQSGGRKQLVQKLAADFDNNREQRQQGLVSRQAAMGLGGRAKQRDGPSLAQMFPFHKDGGEARLGGIEYSDDEGGEAAASLGVEPPSEEAMQVRRKLRELLATAARRSAAGPSTADGSELAVEQLLLEQAEQRAEQKRLCKEELATLRAGVADEPADDEPADDEPADDEPADDAVSELSGAVLARMKRVLAAGDKAERGDKLTKLDEADLEWWSRVDTKRLLEHGEVHVPRRRKPLTMEQILARRRKAREAEDKRSARADEKELRAAIKEAERELKHAKKQARREKRDAAKLARLVRSVQRSKDRDARANRRLNENIAQQLQSDQAKLSKKREKAAELMARVIRNNHSVAVALPATTAGARSMQLFLPQRQVPPHHNAKTAQGHGRFVANLRSAQRLGHMPVPFEGPTLSCKAVDISKLWSSSRKRKAQTGSDSDSDSD